MPGRARPAGRPGRIPPPPPKEKRMGPWAPWAMGPKIKIKIGPLGPLGHGPLEFGKTLGILENPRNWVETLGIGLKPQEFGKTLGFFANPRNFGKP